MSTTESAIGSTPAPWQPPYRSGWLDVATESIAERSTPEAVIYVGIGLAAVAILTVAAWLGRLYAVGTLSLTHVLLGTTLGFYAWLVRRFNVGAVRAFDALDPLLTVDADERASLRFRLAHLPWQAPLILAGLLVLNLVLRFSTSSGLVRGLELPTEPLPFALSMSVLVALAFVGANVLLKVGYQAWLIHRITTRSIHIGLFEVARLYAFATLTGVMAVSLAGTAMVFYLVAPAIAGANDPIGFSSLVLGVGLAASVFVLPLTGVHGRLVAEKERLRSETRRAMAVAFTELHRSVQAHELASMDPLNKAILSLDVEYRGINEAPTWPWRQDTLRWVVSVLMIPLALFVLQQLVPRFLP